jgi:hypothetical protein
VLFNPNSGDIAVKPTQFTKISEGTLIISGVAEGSRPGKQPQEATVKSDVWGSTPDNPFEKSAVVNDPYGPASTAPTRSAKGETPIDNVGALSELRYDGKSFGDWCRAWDSNRPVTEQLEALAALEAFSNVGYGQQAASAIAYGAYSNEQVIAQKVRSCLRELPTDEKSVLVTRFAEVLKTELSAKRRTAAARALAAMGPDAKPALDNLKKTLASADPRERIAAAAAIKMIVGKDQYQKPLSEVLGKELGITVVETDGVWGALPREDSKDDGKAFNNFTESVIMEQQLLFPDGKF